MTYYYEYLPPKYHWMGPISGNQVGGFVFASAFPVLAGLLLLHYADLSWRIFVAVTASPLVLFCLAAIVYLLESPRFLLVNGRSSEAYDVLEKMARRNKRELPGKFALKVEDEVGRSKEQAKGANILKMSLAALKNWKILRTFVCIMMIGTTTRFVTYGMSFIKNDFVFRTGKESSYCDEAHGRIELLKVSDYETLMLTIIGELVACAVLIPVLKVNFSLKISAIVSFGLSSLLTCILYSCPSLHIALALMTIIRILSQVVNLNMWMRLSGLLPTEVRCSLFGLCTFFMYFTLPAMPFLTQDLAKLSPHYTTSVCVLYILVGFIGALLLPIKMHAN